MKYNKFICINSNGVDNLEIGNTYEMETITAGKDFITLKGIKGVFSVDRFSQVLGKNPKRGDIVMAITDNCNIVKGRLYKISQIDKDGCLTIIGEIGMYQSFMFCLIAEINNEHQTPKTFKYKLQAETLFEMAGDVKSTNYDGVEIEFSNSKLKSYNVYKNKPYNNRFNIGEIVFLDTDEELVIVTKNEKEISGVVISGFNKGDKRTYTLNGSNFINKVL